jgi:hypothetical protein
MLVDKIVHLELHMREELKAIIGFCFSESERATINVLLRVQAQTEYFKEVAELWER